MIRLDDFSNLPEIADRGFWSDALGISTRTLARAEARGLKAHRPNARTVLYRKEDIKSYLTGN